MVTFCSSRLRKYLDFRNNLNRSFHPTYSTPNGNSSAQSTPSVIRRQDVPPSPDTIRGSKTLMKLNKALDARDATQATGFLFGSGTTNTKNGPLADFFDKREKWSFYT